MEATEVGQTETIALITLNDWLSLLRIVEELMDQISENQELSQQTINAFGKLYRRWVESR